MWALVRSDQTGWEPGRDLGREPGLTMGRGPWAFSLRPARQRRSAAGEGLRARRRRRGGTDFGLNTPFGRTPHSDL